MPEIQIPPLKWVKESTEEYSAGRFDNYYNVHKLKQGWRCVCNPAYTPRFVLIKGLDTAELAKASANELDREHIHFELNK